MAEMFKVNAPVRKPLFEGVQGENEARSIVFDITPWVDELGDGAVTATAKRSQDSQPYPVTVTKDGNTVTWKPTSTDTAFAGVGSFQLEYTVDDVLAKTCIWSTMVAPSLDPAGDPPDPYDNWLAEMREIAADAIQAAQDADESADDAQAEVYEAEAWATGTKNGTPVPSTADQYENNSKYYSEESYKNAEAWAVGQRGGVDVPSTDPAYENNAKYWAGQAEDLKDATQAIVDEARADVFEAMDGLHEETTAGSALQLISSNYTEDQSPYLFRKSGGGKSIGNREIDTLVGGSVAWNQLVVSPKFTNPTYYSANGATVTAADGVATVTANGDRTVYASFSIKTITANHVYLLGCTSKLSTNNQSSAPLSYTIFNWGAGGAKAFASPTKGVWTTWAFILKPSTGDSYFMHYYPFGTTDNTPAGDVVELKNPQVYDLTAMFGTAVADRLYAMEQAQAGSGVALFRSWFPKDYYAYNTGELMSVKTSAHEMVGFNQWDEEWENGSIEGAGNPVANANCIRSKNYCGCLGGTSYYLNCTTYSGLYYIKVLWFDGDKNHISSVYCNRAAVTSPANARYFKLSTNSASFIYGGTYNHDICFNFSSDRNGEYEPYQKRTYALDDIELRGVPKLDGGEIQYDGDTYEADGTVTRKYGVRAYQSGDESLADAVTDGTNTVYKLATPTTETADPFTSPQIVDAYGTERYVDERTIAVPVGHVTKYPDNLREKLDGLPWDFSTLIAPTEKAYTATRNYTAGSLLIVNNILYKVTANIANGGTITPNTNCTATTLAEVISAL